MLDILLRPLTDRGNVTPGWLVLALACIAAVSYFLGCCNGAVMVSRGILKDDIRQHGSGNGGLTNFCRIHGGALSLLVIFIDVAKAVVSVLLAAFAFSHLAPGLTIFGRYWGGLFCMLGHMFPCMYGFRGGKGVLSGGTIAILIDWRLALMVWGAFLILAVATRYVSLGSCAAGLLFPIGSWLLYRSWLITVLAIIMGGLIILKHKGNIARLIKGQESKFTFKKSPKADPAPASEPPASEPPAEPAPSGEPESAAEPEAPAEPETPENENDHPSEEETNA